MTEKVIVEDAKSPITTEDLDALEGRLGIKIPLQYRQWLLKYNGGRPIPSGFRFKREAGPYTDSTIAWFFAVYDGKFENFETKYRFWKITTKRVPGDLVPIARDPFGNLICLSFSGDDQGRVYFWNHEEEGEEGPATYENCHLIADSFQEFIDHLHDVE